VTHLAQANVSKQPKQPRSTTSILSLPTWLLLAGNMVTLADDSSIAMATTLNYNYGANVIKSDQSPECLKKRWIHYVSVWDKILDIQSCLDTQTCSTDGTEIAQ